MFNNLPDGWEILGLGLILISGFSSAKLKR